MRGVGREGREQGLGSGGSRGAACPIGPPPTHPPTTQGCKDTRPAPPSPHIHPAHAHARDGVHVAGDGAAAARGPAHCPRRHHKERKRHSAGGHRGGVAKKVVGHERGHVVGEGGWGRGGVSHRGGPRAAASRAAAAQWAEARRLLCLSLLLLLLSGAHARPPCGWGRWRWCRDCWPARRGFGSRLGSRALAWSGEGNWPPSTREGVGCTEKQR